SCRWGDTRQSENGEPYGSPFFARRKGAKPPSELFNSPGVAGRQQLCDVAGAAIGNRALLLLDHHGLVDWRLDVEERADGHRVVREEKVGDQLGRVEALLVV